MLAPGYEVHERCGGWGCIGPGGCGGDGAVRIPEPVGWWLTQADYDKLMADLKEEQREVTE